jgi:hypothetical protein
MRPARSTGPLDGLQPSPNDGIGEFFPLPLLLPLPIFNGREGERERERRDPSAKVRGYGSIGLYGSRHAIVPATFFAVAFAHDAPKSWR